MVITKEAVFKKIGEVLDPELHVNIVDLGLIYEVKVEGKNIFILATLTSPTCPFGLVIDKKIREKVKKIRGVGSIDLKFTFDPPWDLSRVNEDTKAQLGLV